MFSTPNYILSTTLHFIFFQLEISTTYVINNLYFFHILISTFIHFFSFRSVEFYPKAYFPTDTIVDRDYRQSGGCDSVWTPRFCNHVPVSLIGAICSRDRNLNVISVHDRRNRSLRADAKEIGDVCTQAKESRSRRIFCDRL